MLLSWPKFSGMAPKLTPRRLGPGMAQNASNVELVSRTIKPLREPLTVLSGVATAADTTIYRFGQALSSDTQYWFAWPYDVDVVKGAISGDTAERTYFYNPSEGLRKTDADLALVGGSGAYPWNSYPLGVKEPTAAPVATVTIDGTGTVESRYYVVTHVTAWGEESAPSPVSNSVDVKPVGATVTLTALGATPPAGYSNISAKRVYRTLTGSLATAFQFVDEIPVSQGSYIDTKDSADLGETIQTSTWAEPPAGAYGLFTMANGIMVTLKDYDIYPSEAYIPYAYPAEYSLAVDYPIVGGAGVGSSAVILTQGNPYMLTGSDPSAMSLVKLESAQSCVSKRSIAAVEGGVIYASPDGLMLVSQTGAVVNLTENLFDRDTWQALNPGSIHGYWHDRQYIAFYDNGTVQAGFTLNMQDGADAAFTLLPNHYATAGYSDLKQDALYLQMGTNIVKWRAGGTYLTAVWKSGITELPTSVNLACAKVRATAYPVVMKLYGNGTLLLDKSVTDAQAFWLPSGTLYETFEIELRASTGEITGAWVASSIDELRGV